MTVTFSDVCRDYLALRGESPDLLPVLEEGEDSAVLTLAARLRVCIPAASVRATLAAPPLSLDELREAVTAPMVDVGGVLTVRMPADYLRLYALRMEDWREALREVEKPTTLRGMLGANAPAWMICRERPMVSESRDASGVMLRIYGSRSFSPPTELIYVPLPAFDGERLTISSSAYRLMLTALAEGEAT